jgi:hypothetical protein
MKFAGGIGFLPSAHLNDQAGIQEGVSAPQGIEAAST